MLSGANAFRISGYKLKLEDRMQQCYLPCGTRNNNSPATTFSCCAVLAKGTGLFSVAKDSAEVWFAKTLADYEINDIAALPPLFCYNF
jgi:hypothetical protein